MLTRSTGAIGLTRRPHDYLVMFAASHAYATACGTISGPTHPA